MKVLVLAADVLMVLIVAGAIVNAMPESDGLALTLVLGVAYFGAFRLLRRPTLGARLVGSAPR